MTPQENRRKDDPRLTALEIATRDLQEDMRNRKREHGETLSSLTSVHKRQGEVIEENRIGTQVILEQAKIETRVILDEISKVTGIVNTNSNRITRLETHHGYIYAWCAAITAFLGWDKIK